MFGRFRVKLRAMASPRKAGHYARHIPGTRYHLTLDQRSLYTRGYPHYVGNVSTDTSIGSGSMLRAPGDKQRGVVRAQQTITNSGGEIELRKPNGGIADQRGGVPLGCKAAARDPEVVCHYTGLLEEWHSEISLYLEDRCGYD